MKKIFFLMTMAIMVLSFTACTEDNDDTPAPKPEQESQADYTIMF